MLEGEISEIQLIDRLVELWRESFTGAIRFESDGIIKIIYFKGGDILSASTNDRADSIDEILMRAGKVSREHVKQAFTKRKETETLGDALLNLGFITRRELTWARRVQVVGVIRSIQAWLAGSFTIVSDYLPKRDEGTLFPLPGIVIELIVTDPDRQRYEKLLEGGSTRFVKAANFDSVFRRIGLNEDAEAIVTLVDGARSASQVAEDSGKDTFNVYRLLHALSVLQLLERPAASPETPSFDVAGSEDGIRLDDAPGALEALPPIGLEPIGEDSSKPMFEFDEAEAARQPTLEVAIEPQALPDYPSVEDERPEPPAPQAEPPRSSWDEPDEEEPPPPTLTMPSWDDPAPTAAAVPVPVPIEPPAEEAEEQWGFDEAQLEAARHATEVEDRRKEPTAAPPAKRGRYGVLVAVMVLFIVGAGGYYGYTLWQGREAAEPPAAVATTEPSGTSPAAATTAPVDEPAETMTMVEAAPAATPEPAPASATEPGPAAAAPVAAAPQPAATAQGGLKEQYDAMARQYLATATGAYTVQIQILCDPGNLSKLISEGGSSVWFVPQPLGNRSCYRVYWGRYDSADEAGTALAQIPASVRDRSAAVKPVPRP